MRALSLSTVVFLGACSVIETGYIVPSEISVTSEMPLVADEAAEVLVVGRPGAVEATGGTLSVTSSVAVLEQVVDDPNGAFVIVTDAVLGDTLVLDYELDRESKARIELDDDLTAVARPSCAGCLLGLFNPPDAEGFSTIVLAMLEEPTPPFTIVNRTNGSVVVATEVNPPPRFPAAQGDLACIFRVDVDADRTSPVQCDLVP